MTKDVDEIEAKIKTAMKFIGRQKHVVWLCGHRYNFGPMKRHSNCIEYDVKTGKIRLLGYDSAIKRRKVNRTITQNSKYRAEVLRAIFNNLIPKVRKVGYQKMELERLNSYLRSKNVPLSL